MTENLSDICSITVADYTGKNRHSKEVNSPVTIYLIDVKEMDATPKVVVVHSLSAGLNRLVWMANNSPPRAADNTGLNCSTALPSQSFYPIWTNQEMMAMDLMIISVGNNHTNIKSSFADAIN